MDYHPLAMRELEDAARWIEEGCNGWGSRQVSVVAVAAGDETSA